MTFSNVCMPTGNRFSLFISMLVFAAFRAYSPAKLRFYSEMDKEWVKNLLRIVPQNGSVGRQACGLDAEAGGAAIVVGTSSVPSPRHPVSGWGSSRVCGGSRPVRGKDGGWSSRYGRTRRRRRSPSSVCGARNRSSWTSQAAEPIGCQPLQRQGLWAETLAIQCSTRSLWCIAVWKR